MAWSKGTSSSGSLSKQEVADNITAANIIYNLNFLIIFLSAYNIAKSKVYAEGYSGGGETMSLVMGMRPDLYTAYLQCSSQWDGAYEPVVQAKTPVYFVVGAHDEYYGSEPSEDAYNNLRELYQKEGLSDEEIDDLLVLDVKDDSYFSDQGVTNQHGQGGGLFVEDDAVMGWLLGK